jgi:hypothetical protein
MVIHAIACSTSGQGAAADADTEAFGDASGVDAGSADSSGNSSADTLRSDPNLQCSRFGNTFEGGGLGTCTLCTDDASTFAGAPAGTCNGAPCGGGCTCYSIYGLQCLCPDLQAQTYDGSMQYCIALSCGSIICSAECKCTDPAHGACVCPVDAGGD